MPNRTHDVVCKITISALFVSRLLLASMLFLTLMHIGVHVAYFGFGHDHLKGLTPLFDMNRENNIPTWYSGTVFLATAAALAVVATAKHQTRAPFARHWTGL